MRPMTFAKLTIRKLPNTLVLQMKRFSVVHRHKVIAEHIPFEQVLCTE